MGQSNKLFYTILLLAAISIISVVVYSVAPSPNPGHSADQIAITVNGVETTLQQAINDGTIGDSSSPPNPSGGSSPASVFFCQAPSTNACNISTPFKQVGQVISKIKEDGSGDITSLKYNYLCCGIVDANMVETDEVTIGVDNNGGSNEDCWTETGGMLPSPYCGAKKWSTSIHNNQWCVDQLLAYYITLVPAEFVIVPAGGWVVEGWVDTGAPSTCIDGSSDQIKVRLSRYFGS